MRVGNSNFCNPTIDTGEKHQGLRRGAEVTKSNKSAAMLRKTVLSGIRTRIPTDQKAGPSHPEAGKKKKMITLWDCWKKEARLNLNSYLQVIICWLL